MIYNSFYARHPIRAASVRHVESSVITTIARTLPLHDGDFECSLVTRSVGELRPSSSVINRRRLNRAAMLLRLFRDEAIEQFAPVELQYADCVQLMFPPVAITAPGETGDIVLDGTHRLYALLTAGIPTVQLLLLRTNHMRLACDPTSWNSLRVTSNDAPIEKKLANYRRHPVVPLVTVTLNGEWMWRGGEGLSREAVPKDDGLRCTGNSWLQS